MSDLRITSIDAKICEFEIPDLSNLEIIKPIVKVSDKDINDAVEKIAKENIGTKTIKLVSKAKLDGIVVESSNVIFIEKTKIIKLADSLGIFLWSRSNE